MKIEKLIQLRRELHQHPELSGQECWTVKRIVEFMKPLSPDKIIEGLGGTGLAIIWSGKKQGETILLRCDLDALPISEINDFEYRSKSPNISHKCGHDGHMAIMAGLASMISERGIPKGKVILLFQPAEETGQGAERILDDPKFNELKPNYVFALHNLPGFPTGKIIIRKQHFASASKGMIIKLTGKTSHAAEPENGRSPAIAVVGIIQALTHLSDNVNFFKDFILITIIHAVLGEIAFGTTPGYGEIRATLRSFRNDDMERLTEMAVGLVKEIAESEKLEVEITWQEEFPATINDEYCYNNVREAAGENQLEVQEVETPFKWSEDFGYFTNKFKGALFGIGAGINHSQLHNPDYDFPDGIIETGVNMFWGIIQTILEKD